MTSSVGWPMFAPGRFSRVERGAFEFAFEFAGCRRFRFPEPAGFRQIYRASFRLLEFAFSFIFDLVLRRLRARSIATHFPAFVPGIPPGSLIHLLFMQMCQQFPQLPKNHRVNQKEMGSTPPPAASRDRRERSSTTSSTSSPSSISFLLTTITEGRPQPLHFHNDAKTPGGEGGPRPVQTGHIADRKARACQCVYTFEKS